MTQYEIDTEDAAVFALFGLAAAATVGIADVTLFNYAFSDVVDTVGSNHGVTIATLISAATFGWVFYTNEPDLEKMDDEYTYAVVGTAALIVAVPFVPKSTASSQEATSSRSEHSPCRVPVLWPSPTWGKNEGYYSAHGTFQQAAGGGGFVYGSGLSTTAIERGFRIRPVVRQPRLPARAEPPTSAIQGVLFRTTATASTSPRR